MTHKYDTFKINEILEQLEEELSSLWMLKGRSKPAPVRSHYVEPENEVNPGKTQERDAQKRRVDPGSSQQYNMRVSIRLYE